MTFVKEFGNTSKFYFEFPLFLILESRFLLYYTTTHSFPGKF